MAGLLHYNIYWSFGLMPMSQFEIDVALQTAFDRCRQLGYPLSEAQQQTLRRVVAQQIGAAQGALCGNPLDELTPEEQRQFVDYVRTVQGDTAGPDWKTRLLNDWLSGQDSGAVQFIRDRYGLQWLDQVQPQHLAPHLDSRDSQLQVGDRIEVSNGLWEWVQEQGPCRREWVACQVVSLSEQEKQGCCAVVRFSSGAEYEIQGLYDWNRYQWRRQRSPEAS